MELRQPALVASRTSGVDGSSEGGRISTIRLPYALVLYSVPLLDEIRRGGYGGKLSAEPVLVDGIYCLKIVYDGERPKGVPVRWHGHRVIVEKAKGQAAQGQAKPGA
jgi:hypothetical protein